MHQLFEIFKALGITSNKLDRILKITDSELESLVKDSLVAIASNTNVDRESPFNFVANRTLSGGDFPCSEFACRKKNIDILARNSILYADTVFIQNPFDAFFHYNHFSSKLRYDIGVNIALLYYTKPLFDAGIFQIASSYHHVCKACLKKLKIITRSYERKIESVELSLFNSAISDFTYAIKRDEQKTPYLVISGPKDIIEHPIILYLFDTPEFDKISARRNKRVLAPNEVIDLGLVEFIVSPILNDLIAQNYYSNIYHSEYLTNRAIDVKIITENQSKQKLGFHNSVTNSLSHKVPFIPEIDFKKLINLREKEGEAFQVYRSSLRNFLQNAKSNSHNLQEAFRDEIEPEIYKMNQTIKTTKKLIRSDIAKDLMIGSTFVSVGLFSNLLPPNLSQLIAGLGGINYLSKFGDNIKKHLTTEATIKENKYYFVWKLSKL